MGDGRWLSVSLNRKAVWIIRIAQRLDWGLVAKRTHQTCVTELAGELDFEP